MMNEMSQEEGLYHRQTLFDKAKRVVVKVGSAILTCEDGIDQDVVDNLAKEISFLRDTGREVILVSSGAVAAGRKAASQRRSRSDDQTEAGLGRHRSISTHA